MERDVRRTEGYRAALAGSVYEVAEGRVTSVATYTRLALGTRRLRDDGRFADLGDDVVGGAPTYAGGWSSP